MSSTVALHVPPDVLLSLKVCIFAPFVIYFPLHEIAYIAYSWKVYNSYVCQSVCSFVCWRISEITHRNVTSFDAHISCGCESVILFQHCDMLICTFGFVDDAMFADSCPCNVDASRALAFV